VKLDAAAIRELEPVLRRWALRAVGDRDLAGDLVQETLLAAVEQLPKFEGRSKLRTWLISILSHKVIDHYRRRRPAALEIPADDSSHADLLVHPTVAQLEQTLDDRRAVDRVEQLLPALPEMERMCLLLIDVEGVGREEAQEALGVTAVHLRVLLHRARNRLRRMLEHVDLRHRA
jgi:RNA polymerase sigma-70 factor (ECF subfamily)